MLREASLSRLSGNVYCQSRGFCAGGLSTECGIAVRKSTMLCNNVVPELSDHCEGFKGCVHAAGNFRDHSFIDFNRARLYFFGLCSLKRHKEEHALYWAEVIVHVAAGPLGA